MRVTDYIAEFLVLNGIEYVFMVTGGNAMYLHDSFGHHKDLKCVCFHHEQACAIAAEAYARYTNKPAVVCVTNGPGATNTLTGVVCAYMGSIPMLILSGQSRYKTTVAASGLKLRTRGIQEFDIVRTVKTMSKYSRMIKSSHEIKHCIEKAFTLCMQDRKGPCWLDIPLDIQASTITFEKIKKIHFNNKSLGMYTNEIENIINKIKIAKRPVIIAGNGIRLGDAVNVFLRVLEKLNLPVVNTMSSIDIIPHNNQYYIGLTGMTGSRAGNFIVQKSDLILSLGSRLSFTETGFDYKHWAVEAYKIVVDIDAEELKKNSINADISVCADVKDILVVMYKYLKKPLEKKTDWLNYCDSIKKQYPLLQKKFMQTQEINPYCFFHTLSHYLENDDAIVVSVGTSRVMGSQSIYIKGKQRFITNVPTAAMGYDLPAAIGVCIAKNETRTILITGEGSLQMNIQELQTIIHHKYPICIFVVNNQGYQSIRETQKNYFTSSFVGIGPDSEDISFPNLRNIAYAYGFNYRSIVEQAELNSIIQEHLCGNLPAICEVFVSTKQSVEPKIKTTKMPDGSMVSSSLDNMYPFI